MKSAKSHESTYLQTDIIHCNHIYVHYYIKTKHKKPISNHTRTTTKKPPLKTPYVKTFIIPRKAQNAKNNQK